MSNKTAILVLLGFSVLLLVGCTQAGQNPTTGNNTLPADNSNNSPAALSATVHITATGYDPQNVTVKKGGTVTWINDTDTPNWPATAQHPTHTKYPGSGIEKCGTAEQATIFDACKGLAKGESFAFKFDDVGQWGYHEHLSVKMFGKVNVIE